MQDTKDVARRLVADMFSGTSQPPGELDGLAAAVGRLRMGFPDLAATTEQLVAEDGLVAARLLLRGTHTGPYLGVAPTGRAIDVPATIFADVLEGRVRSASLCVDGLGLLEQIGSLNVPLSAGNGGHQSPRPKEEDQDGEL